MAKHDYIIVVPALAYFLVNALSLLNSPFEFQDLKSLVGPSLFVGFYFAVRCYRDLGMENQFALFLRAIPYGSIFMFMWILDNIFFHPGRMAGGSGNAIPFAMTCVMLFSICMLNTLRFSGWERVLNAVAVMIFFVALIRSETRGMYIAILPVSAILFLYAVVRSQNKMRIISIGVLISIFGTFALSQSTTFTDRSSTIGQFAYNISQGGINSLIENDHFEWSIQNRLIMVRKAICVILERPINGYGKQNRQEVLLENIPANKLQSLELCRGTHPGLGYSHFHNGFLTAAVDAGIWGMASVTLLWLSPLFLAFRSINRNSLILNLAFASILVSIYGMAGLTNILFGHDIVDSLFLYSCLFLTLHGKYVPDTERL